MTARKNVLIQHQSGLSLVELMIAMALGLVLTLGVTRLFMDSLQSKNAQHELNTVNDGGRVVMNLMRQDLLRAGFKGCATDVTLGSYDAATSANDIADAVEMQSQIDKLNDGISTPATDLASNLHAASDSIEIVYLRPFPRAGSNRISVSNTTVTLREPSPDPDPAVDQNTITRVIGSNTTLFIGNCTRLEVAKLASDTTVGATTLTIKKALKEDFGDSDILLYEGVYRNYSIGKENAADPFGLFVGPDRLINNAAALTSKANKILSVEQSGDAFTITLGLNNTGSDYQKTFATTVTRRNVVQ
ncbi:PilW family protein [Parendozoicomonas haliclonae]|uniref:Type IV pilus assembly protein PilW n=1 Tax=Parendozoicomonas haliclonae TaxID=1960125 RepID=A0A1X7AQL4_9GAMM|nr:prepilin-type N-terminal cleavage/methylation domain-containing protein [Parendozoicomonas haliclonae]SMA50380.1 hypothetical protein EHSB41UT_04177 [Parendozoicomonas haliclonae]